MRVFVAGASGAIGRQLLPMLLAAGHEVTGMTRSEERAERIRAQGAEAVVCDALDAPACGAAVVAARPDVVVHQLTDLPARLDYRRPDYGQTPRLRTEGTANLIAAAQSAGARRLVAQSIAFMYAPQGDRVKAEDAPLMKGVPGAFGEAVAAVRDAEQQIAAAGGLDGLVLRYGFFYGPGTYYASDGTQAEDVRRRRVPLVGDGAGVFSFVHVEDAAAADRGRLRARAARRLQRRRRRARRLRRVAAGLRRGDRGQAAEAGAEVARPSRRGQLRRRHGHRGPRRLEREGQARARLAASPPELAAGVPRGARLNRPPRTRVE